MLIRPPRILALFSLSLVLTAPLQAADSAPGSLRQKLERLPEHPRLFLNAQQEAAVRAKIGLDQTAWRITAAAPASTEVMQYFAALGLALNEGWGMSECSCFGTLNPPDDNRVGTVGRPLPGVEIRIADDGEMLVRAPSVMKGYRGDPEKTAEAIDRDGWLHTGDIAQIDGDGYLRIVDRKKEIIINSAGKNMSPANIELKLRAASRLIAHAVCIGDRRPYNVALIALDREMCGGRGPEELRPAIEDAVAAANADCRAASRSSASRSKGTTEKQKVKTVAEAVERIATREGEQEQRGTVTEQPDFELSRQPKLGQKGATKKKQHPELEKAGINVNQTNKGWSVQGLSQEQFDGIKEEYQGKRLPNGSYFFRSDPTEGLTNAAREAAEELNKLPPQKQADLLGRALERLRQSRLSGTKKNGKPD